MSSAEDEFRQMMINIWYNGLTTGLSTARGMAEAVRIECSERLGDGFNPVLTAQINVLTGLSESLLEAEAEVYANGGEVL